MRVVDDHLADRIGGQLAADDRVDVVVGVLLDQATADELPGIHRRSEVEDDRTDRIDVALLHGRVDDGNHSEEPGAPQVIISDVSGADERSESRKLDRRGVKVRVTGHGIPRSGVDVH